MSEILRVLLFSFLIPIVILVIIGVLDNMKESNKAKKMFQKFENDFRIEGDLISLKINAKKTRMFLLKTSKKNLQKELNTIDEKIIKIDGIIKETIKFNLRNAEKQAKEQNFSVAINIIDEQKKYIDVLEDKHFANKIKFVKKRINDAILDINSKEIMNKLELVDGLLKSSKFKEALILLDLCQKKANEFKFEDLQPKITGKITLVNSYKKLTELFKISERIKLDDLAKILDMERADLINNLIEWNTFFTGLKLVGDEVVLGENSNLNRFVDLLDTQYDSWDKKEKFGTGKKD